MASSPRALSEIELSRSIWFGSWTKWLLQADLNMVFIAIQKVGLPRCSPIGHAGLMVPVTCPRAPDGAKFAMTARNANNAADPPPLTRYHRLVK